MTPTPLTDADIRCLFTDCGYSMKKFAKAIESEVNRRWTEMLVGQEPVALMHPDKTATITIDYLADQPAWVQEKWKGGAPLYTHPAPPVSAEPVVPREWENYSKHLDQITAPPVSAEPVAWMYDAATYPEGDLRGRQWKHNVFSTSKPYTENNMVRNLRPLFAHHAPDHTALEASFNRGYKLGVSDAHLEKKLK